MAATSEMLDIALRNAPNACCLVPERREEVTTEGGLEVVGAHNTLKPYIRQIRDGSIRVSLFIDADEEQIRAASELHADIVELHTGPYCHAVNDGDEARTADELERLVSASTLAHSLGLEVHAGHGLTFDSVGPVAAIPEMTELNIGHYLIGEAIFGGLHSTVQRMRHMMDRAREEASGLKTA